MKSPRRLPARAHSASAHVASAHVASSPVVSRACPGSWRWIVLILVFLHMWAVVAEPLHFFSRSDFQAAPEFLAIRRWTAPYAEWLFLDHGYFFFAPNPGPSHLVAVSEGKSPGAGVELDRYALVFPDRKRQWPRLLYHRFFMLSEFYNNTFAPEGLLSEDMVDLSFVDRWKRDRDRYEQLRGSMGKSLAKELGVERVELHRLERILLTPDQVLRQGWRLSDPRGLVLLEEGPGPSVAAERPSLGPVSPFPASEGPLP